MSTNPEKLITGAEQGVEAGESAREQIEKQRAKYERLGELAPESGEKSAERARIEALETARRRTITCRTPRPNQQKRTGRKLQSNNEKSTS